LIIQLRKYFFKILEQNSKSFNRFSTYNGKAARRYTSRKRTREQSALRSHSEIEWNFVF